MIKHLTVAALVAVGMLASAPALATQSYGPIFHLPKHFHFHHHFNKPPAPLPLRGGSAPSASDGGGGNNMAPAWVSGGYFLCVIGKAAVEKRRANKVGRVFKTTYRQEAEVFGACLLPIPVERRASGRGWWTLGGNVIWFLTGRHEGHADPDFAIKQMDKRAFIY